MTGVEVVWAAVAAGRLDDATRAALAADVDDARLAKLRRFHRPADTDRGLAAHALLRRTLAPLVGVRPAQLRFEVWCAACGSREHGKPHLPGREVEFNLSHSGDRVALALAPTPVGVDVERRRGVDWAGLRAAVFTDAEWDAAEQDPEPDRERTRLWSRKEAAVKASGHGLALPMRTARVSRPTTTGPTGPTGPTEPAGTTEPTGPAGTAGWTVALGEAGGVRGWDFDLGDPAYAGAVGLLTDDSGELEAEAAAPVVRQARIS